MYSHKLYTPKLPKRHTTQPIVINGNKVEIDDGMVSTVLFFNSLPGITTKFSCEGYDDSKLTPYIVFTSTVEQSLRIILNSLREQVDMFTYLNYGICEIDVWNGENRYCIRWSSIESFRMWGVKRGLYDCEGTGSIYGDL